jgi:hypothetical protein
LAAVTVAEEPDTVAEVAPNAAPVELFWAHTPYPPELLVWPNTP